MNKQTKMILGIALVGIAGYMIYKQSNKVGFASAATVQGGTEKNTGKMRHLATAADVQGGVMSIAPKTQF